ncbi:MAG: 3-phosphoserine/phosphohydroxythreonine transaminase [Gammaproteobacteria bacterium]|nr:3-phosphoserine/phosphohydroxythreonine transaminase [Gammaproteobacteria bacterium]NIR82104.1 3-phosphoserine/phosphohydroxythreonine transaminase [Gammaproteobacteria bacterium]NIR89337.1 3-phosphoserine/phosphohydroxythreonine transaminase [Gammaproteobacteria bacterium]NIU03214.1 3-phosphoserine/phosphohydroxythreonine transaminase [Gammaproteobacteria bacterium]NIV74509.1 3-phosphoserine/phosphohydroxythreonine transaminase [Gammaproteobacteria bacterium]
MSNRVYNFCAGPCTLPLEVLEEVQRELVDYQGTGMSLIEMSHRAPEYDAVHKEAMSLALEVFEVPEEFSVLFLQGGAHLQFAMLPMNLLHEGRRGAYVHSGHWAGAALRDAKPHGDVYTAWDGEGHHYTRMPAPEEIALEENTRFLHVTSNETIGGIRMTRWPALDVPLVADMSSELMSRPIPWERFDLVYGGVQKNLGPAGAAVVFVRESILGGTNRALASYLRYDVHHEKQSLHNTPPVFVIYVIGKVLKWMQRKGGLRAVEREAEARAGLIYQAIDESDGYYRSPVAAEDRSLMNVVFRLPSEALESRFVAQSKARGLVSLKGHRSVGGCRASLYNAMPYEGAAALAEFMHEFRRGNG